MKGSKSRRELLAGITVLMGGLSGCLQDQDDGETVDDTETDASTNESEGTDDEPECVTRDYTPVEGEPVSIPIEEIDPPADDFSCKDKAWFMAGETLEERSGVTDLEILPTLSDKSKLSLFGGNISGDYRDCPNIDFDRAVELLPQRVTITEDGETLCELEFELRQIFEVEE